MKFVNNLDSSIKAKRKLVSKKVLHSFKSWKNSYLIFIQKENWHFYGKHTTRTKSPITNVSWKPKERQGKVYCFGFTKNGDW